MDPHLIAMQSFTREQLLIRLLDALTRANAHGFMARFLPATGADCIFQLRSADNIQHAVTLLPVCDPAVKAPLAQPLTLRSGLR